MDQLAFDFIDVDPALRDTLPEIVPPKSFVLLRIEDATGVSGTGIIAEGVIFKKGKVVMSWLTNHSSIAIYDSLKELINIHGHHGKTKLIYT